MDDQSLGQSQSRSQSLGIVKFLLVFPFFFIKFCTDPCNFVSGETPLTGKRARTEVKDTSRRATGQAEDDILSLTPLSGPV